MNDWQPIGISGLVRQAKADSEKLGELLLRYHGYLKFLALQHLNSVGVVAKLDASDIVQDTYKQAHRGFDQFQGVTHGQFSAWLKTILRNSAIDAIRRALGPEHNVRRDVSMYYTRSDSAILFLREPVARDETPSEIAIQGEEALLLAQAIDELPLSQQKAICLRYFDGMSIQETADELNKTLAATAGLLKRGIRTLRTSLPLKLQRRLSTEL